MATTAMQRLIEKRTGVSRQTSGAKAKLSKGMKTAAKRTSRGGGGG